MAASRASSGREPLARLQSKIEAAPAGIVVALSGGRDSLALLGACVQLRAQGVLGARALRAIHVDHGLHAQSAQWASYCRRIARALQVPLSVRRVSITLAKGESLEAEARRHRYAVFDELLARHECLLTAHHLEDQAETFLLQLMRGAGMRGLAAMPESTAFGRGSLVRPWLEVPRAQLLQLLDALREPKMALGPLGQIADGPGWVEDPSNQDLRFDRNYLRERVMPIWLERWPSAASVIARSARHAADTRELLDELAAADLAALRPPEMAETAVINVISLSVLSAARQRNALRAWLTEAGLSLPDARHLERIRCELPMARRDAQPIVRWPGGEVRRFDDRLYALAPQAKAPLGAAGSLSLAWRWRLGQTFSLGAEAGGLRFEHDPQGAWNRRDLPRQLWVRTRVGGESIALQSRAGRRRIKSLLREARVLPWWRERVPLLGAQEEVIAVGDLFLAGAYRASAETPVRDRLRLIWERPAGWRDAAR